MKMSLTKLEAMKVSPSTMRCNSLNSIPITTNSRSLHPHTLPIIHMNPQIKRRKTIIASSSTDQHQDSASEAAAVERISSFRWEALSKEGNLIIAPLQDEEVGAASVVLTRAFATSPQGVPIEDGRKYCENMLKIPPKGVFLVGRLYPYSSDDSNDSLPPSWMPEGKSSRVVATASISFHPDSRESFQTLQPPDEEAYLCNIAVDPKFRRQGIARQMLGACESLARENGFEFGKKLYLHVRLGDDAAKNLYLSSGFEELDSDSWLVKLRGMTPATLMVKEL